MPDIQHQLFINGEFVDARSGETFATANPATEEKIADVASAGVEDVDAAVRAARAQMEPGSEWQKMKPRDRGKILWRIADMLSARAGEIGRIETIDNGKPIFESEFVDTPAAAECLYYFAGWSGKVTGETIPIADNAFTYTLREPVGVVGAITPWNFPLMLAVWKIAPALACGNTVVIKPASNTSLSLLKFAEYAKECGLPAGVLNVVPGRGSVVGNAIVDHPGVGAIASKDQMESVLSYIDAGKNEGAKLVAGGERADIGTGKGYFIKPTIFDDVDPNMRIAREEIFGPVLATIRFNSAEDAIEKANATVYGLAAAVWTRDVSKAHRIAKSIKAGTVWINTYNLYDPALPFGGFKESGFGRDQGRDALEKYTQTKSVWVQL